MGSPSPFSDELALALRVVHAASLLTKAVLRSLANHVDATSKSDDSPVTVADFAAQALIISALHAAFPGDAFLGEESAQQLRSDDALADRVWQLVQRAEQTERAQSSDVQHVHAQEAESSAADAAEATAAGTPSRSPQECRGPLVFPASKGEMLDLIDLGTGTRTDSGRVWVMDPVDGTATFMTGNQYAVALCLLVDGVQQVGVVGCPNLLLDDSFWLHPSISEERVDADGYGVVLSAVKGQGTYVRSMLSSSPSPSALPASPPPSSSPSSLFGPARRIAPSRSQSQPPSFSSSSPLNFVESAWGSTTLLQPLHRLIALSLSVPPSAWPGTTLWSQQMKYIALTLSAADVMLRVPKDERRYTHVWDHAGGQLLLEEAGGWVRDLRGGTVDMGRGRVLKGEVNFGMVALGPAALGERERVLEAVEEALRGEGMLG